MTAYSLYSHVSAGPSLVAYTSTPFQSGITVTVTQGGMWFDGYWWWVPSGGDTAAQKFCLYSLTGHNAGTIVPGATVMSGPLTASSWNFVALSASVPVAIGMSYVATTAWTPAHGFPDTQNVFNTVPIVNGPLTAYSDQGGSLPVPYSMPQGSFDVTTADPAAGLPARSSNSANFGIDVQVSDTGPAGYQGPFEIWPNTFSANAATVADTTVGDEVGTKFTVSQPCVLGKVRYWSPPGVTVLASYAAVYTITGPDAGVLMELLSSPSWSGAAGSGVVSASFSGTTVLPAGDYAIVVGNSGSSEWSSTDSSTSYWTTGYGANGITWGPLTVDKLSVSSQSFVFDGAGAANTPPFSDGSGTLARSPSVFAMSGPQVPYLSTGSSPVQNYWVSPVLTLVPPGVTGVTAALALAAVPGSVSVASSASAAGAPVALAAPAGTVAASSSVAGVTAVLPLAGVPGSAASGAVANGIAAPVALAALAGSVSASSRVAGVAAVLALGVPAGAVSSPGAPRGPLTLTASDAAAGVLSAGTQRLGGPS